MLPKLPLCASWAEYEMINTLSKHVHQAQSIPATRDFGECHAGCQACLPDWVEPHLFMCDHLAEICTLVNYLVVGIWWVHSRLERG